MADTLSSGDPQGLSKSNRFVPSLYSLSLTVNHLKPTFTGKLAIDLHENAASPAASPEGFRITLNSSKLVFTGASLKIASVSAGPAEEKLKIVYNKDNEEVSFFSAGAVEIKPDAAVSLSLVYVGQVNTIKTYSDPTFGLFKTNYLDTVSGTSSNYILATHNQPCFTRRIFPLIDEIGFKVPIKLEITTLNKFKVVSNSPLQSKQPISMSEDALFTFKQTPPMSAHLFAFVVGDLERRDASDDSSASSVPISFYTPIGEGHRATYPLEVASKTLPFLAQQLQTPYPLDKLDFVALPFLSDMVMENWGMITLHHEQVLSGSSPQQIRQLIAHELVHQWVGNLVSFNDWKWMWLNESFATWLGNYTLKELGLEKEDSANYTFNAISEKLQLMNQPPVSIAKFASSLDSLSHNCSLNTGSLFNKEVYEKGIALLDTLGALLSGNGANNYKVFLGGVKELIDEFKYKSVSPRELWKILDQKTPLDLNAFIENSMETEGYPIVEVDVVENGKIKLTVDKGYEVAAFVKSKDGAVDTVIAKSEIVTQAAASDFACLSSVGYYQVKYSLKAWPSITANFKTLTSSDLLTIFADYGKFLESPTTSSPEDLIVFVSLLNSLVEPETAVDFQVLRIALSTLESLNNILLHNSQYTEFSKWLDTFTTKLFVKIGGWDSVTALKKETQYSAIEMSARNSLLLLNLDNKSFKEVGSKLFKNLVNSGIKKNFTPKELMPSILNLTMMQASQKEYKQILGFVKNANVSILDNSDCPVQFFQTCAVSSLSFTNNVDLLSKSLNFVLTNIDSKLIELALIGFQYKNDKDLKLKLFNWYSVNYNTLVLRSLQQNNSWSVQLQATLENTTKIILGDIMVFDKELLKLKAEFIDKAQKKLPQHGLVDILSAYQEQNDFKTIIGSYYDSLVPYL